MAGSASQSLAAVAALHETWGMQPANYVAHQTANCTAIQDNLLSQGVHRRASAPLTISRLSSSGILKAADATLGSPCPPVAAPLASHRPKLDFSIHNLDIDGAGCAPAKGNHCATREHVRTSASAMYRRDSWQMVPIGMSTFACRWLLFEELGVSQSSSADSRPRTYELPN